MKSVVQRLIHWIKLRFFEFKYVRQCDNVYITKDMIPEVQNPRFIRMLKMIDYALNDHLSKLNEHTPIIKAYGAELYEKICNDIVFIITTGERNDLFRSGGYYYMHIGIGVRDMGVIVDNIIIAYINERNMDSTMGARLMKKSRSVGIFNI